jgi:hypothetical protein
MREGQGIETKTLDCVSKEYRAKDEIYVEAVVPSPVTAGPKLEALSN